MLYHDMLPRITTAPTPIPTFCHVFIALASRPSPYGWAIRSLIHTSGRARMFPGLDESEEIRKVPIYQFSEFYASLRLRARVTVPTTASDRVQLDHKCGQYGSVPAGLF